MNNQQLEDIKATLKTRGWLVIRELFYDETADFNTPIDYGKKSMEETGREYVARNEARIKLEAILTKIESYNQEFKNNTKKYI